MRWTEEAQATLERIAREGGSFSDAAATLGCTRNMIAGRANRSGVSFHNGVVGQRPGEGHSEAKLTDSDVRWLRDSQLGELRKRAETLGISPCHASAIKNRRCWAHVQ